MSSSATIRKLSKAVNAAPSLDGQNMTQDQVELSILRKYTEQHKNAELRAPGSKCARELDMRNVLAKITGHVGQELEYGAQFWLDRLAPVTHNPQSLLYRCSDSRVSERDHRWHARAFTNAGTTPAWDRIRELEAHSQRPAEQKPTPWKRFGKRLLTHLVAIVLAVATAVAIAWAIYVWGPQNRTRQIASIEFENSKPFVDSAVFGNDWAKNYWNVRYFRIQVYNKSNSSTIRAKYVELTDLRQLEEGVFKPWDNAEPVPLKWDARSKDIPPHGRVLVSFARIYPPELQTETDALLSGDLKTPQLRFTVDGWPRKMTSHVPPGTHRFKLTVFFEDIPPTEAEFELQWSGNHSESVESMAQEVKVRLVR